MGPAPLARRSALRAAGLLAAAALAFSALPFARGADLERVLWILGACLLAGACVAAAAAGRPETARALSAALDGAADRLEAALPRRRAALWLAAGILLYAAVWSVASILRHQGLNSSGFDLAIQHQVVWNLAHGRGFESSIEVRNYLGDHVALTLPLFAPVLWIWDDVRALLIAQSAVLGLGAWPVYRIARRMTRRRADSLVWAGVYLLTPAVGFMNKYDFHDLVLALPFLLAAIDACERSRFGRASIWMLLALATREEVGLAVAALALYCAFARKRALWGGAWAVGSVLWAVAALYVVIPHFRGAESDTLARYAWLGSTPGEIARTLLTRPWTLFEGQYHRVRRVVFGAQLLWPLAGLPLLSAGRLLISLPNLGVSAASSAISQNSIYFQYSAPILPGLFWAALAGYRRLAGRWRRGPALALVLFCLAAANVADPALVKPVGRPYTIVDGIAPRPNRDTFRRAAARVPGEADLLASNDLAPHFSARRELYVLHLARPNPETSWIAIDLTDDRHLQPLGEVASWVERALSERRYRVDFFEGGILLLRKEGAEDWDARRRLEREIVILTGRGS